MTRVVVLGAAGRMGSTVCEAVAAADDLDLVAAVDPGGAGRRVGGVEVTAARPQPGEADVAVDFTRRDAAMDNLRWCAAAGVHAVSGTTGMSDDDLAELQRCFAASPGTGCVIAANFAIGAVLMMRFAELAAPWFETAEIVELHHDRKVDAPSGTAVQTARRMADASATWGADPTVTEVVDGARGGVGPGGIRIHSVRLAGLIAHQEVLLGTVGQSLIIRHDSYDRTSFMPGVLLAVRAVAGGGRPGLTVGLDALLSP